MAYRGHDGASERHAVCRYGKWVSFTDKVHQKMFHIDKPVIVVTFSFVRFREQPMYIRQLYL